MAIFSGTRTVDLQRAATALDETTVRLATEREMADMFPGCELGAEPPIGAMFKMKTVMDSQLRDDEYMVMQAGSHDQAIRMRRDDWERVCEPIVAPITRG